MAGGLDRAGLNYGILFQEGRVGELSFNSGSPKVSGTYAALLGGGTTANMAESFSSFSLGFKDDINDKLSYAVLFGQPIGADAKYTAGFYTGLEAHWKSNELAALLKYKIGSGTSVFGGLRYVISSADIKIPTQLLGFSGAYSATADKNGKLGYLVGAAYEKPEIALRVSLTYTSEITHDFATAETHPALGGTLNSTTDITLPQTLTLDAQSGIAENTLLFGSIRWAEWSKWHVDPVGFHGLTAQEVTGLDNNVVTFSLGVGRKLSDSLSIFGQASYEKANGGISSRLSPTDGMRGLSVGAVWTKDQMKVTAGLQYAKRGDAIDSTGTRFSGNSSTVLGVKMDFTF